jgi:hypothetical protein
VAVAVEVGDAFLGRRSHELGVEARLGARWVSSAVGATTAVGAGSTATGSRAGGGHASLTAVARWDQHRTKAPVVQVAPAVMAQGVP